jgi:DNA polymerase Ligase (LigD)
MESLVLRFVLLEHQWNGVHWDLMLEVETGGDLRTWAFDEPLVAGRDLQARALPDHRLVYLGYEGEISGGRGFVRRIDRGMYERLVWDADVVRVRLSGSYLTGEFALRRAVSGSGCGGDGDPGSLWLARFGN